MRKRLYVLLVVYVITGSGVQAAVERIQNGIEWDTARGNVRIQFYTDGIVRVVKWLPAGSPAKVSLSVVVKDLNDLDLALQDSTDMVSVSSGKLRLILSKASGQIHYSTLDGMVILKEDGHVITPVVIPHEKAFHVEQLFQLTPDEGVYGLGQYQQGCMNYRGRTVTLVQTNTDAVNPFLVSTQGYGILWDNYSKTIFSDKPERASLWSDVGDNIDYYFVYGRTMDEVIAGYRYLTGPAPLYGRWAYGYWQSKEHYKTRDELLGIAREYRKRKIPIDNMIQDWNYWGGNNNWSSMVFDQTKYPNPREMVDILHDMHFHLMISIWPGLGPESQIYKDMDARGYLYDKVGWAGFKYYDAYNPAANQLYWQHLKAGLYSQGIDAWWIDSTEPDVVNALTKEGTEAWMKNVGTNHLGSWARYLNGFSLSMTDALYQNLRKETDQRRVYILTRSTFAGQQRNAITTWSGDIGASWEIYKRQITAGLNHCMSGIPYWTFDIGAFVIGSYGGVFSNGGVEDPAYRELYTRMFQFGSFCPIFRSHGSETPREIWQYKEFTKPMVRFDTLRYRLMPYIYSLAWQVTDQGYTLMRGLPMDFVQDKQTYNIDDQFMFGPAIMVCPVTQYMLHRPPENSVLITPEHFRTNDGRPGLNVTYYNDVDFNEIALRRVEPDIDLFWYTGWPAFIDDHTFSMRWEGKLIPTQTGKHRFHMKSFGPKRVYLDGKELPTNYHSVEFYTETVNLEAGKAYDFKFETANSAVGAFRARLFWKTPEIHAREKIIEQREQTRQVYLPAGHQWIDFWTGETLSGARTITADAPIDKIPLLIKAGSIIPLGPFMQYATEKPADPIELRIYPGADGTFTLYEDENDNYNYEKGLYATITFTWDDSERRLILSDRKGQFPGMLENRTFNVVLVTPDHGMGIEITDQPDKIVTYTGSRQVVQF